MLIIISVRCKKPVTSLIHISYYLARDYVVIWNIFVALFYRILLAITAKMKQNKTWCKNFSALNTESALKGTFWCIAKARPGMQNMLTTKEYEIHLVNVKLWRWSNITLPGNVWWGHLGKWNSPTWHLCPAPPSDSKQKGRACCALLCCALVLTGSMLGLSYPHSEGLSSLC